MSNDEAVEQKLQQLIEENGERQQHARRVDDMQLDYYYAGKVQGLKEALRLVQEAQR